MQFTKSALSLLLLASRATAWTAHGLPRGRFLVHLHAVAGISTDVMGQEKTASFRLQFKEGDKTLSPWHDIELSNEDGSFNMVRKMSRMENLVRCDEVAHTHTHHIISYHTMITFIIRLSKSPK